MSKQVVNQVAPPPQMNQYPPAQGFQPGYPVQPPMYPPQGPGYQNYPNNPNPNYYNGPPPGRPVSPAYAPQQPPTVVYVQGFNASSGKCQYCNSNASVISRKRTGCAIWAWCTVLLLFTGICCWIPCCIDDCYDMEFICSNCNNVRGHVRSPMGCWQYWIYLIMNAYFC